MQSSIRHTRARVLAAAVAILAGGCEPDIAQDDAPDAVTVTLFDPTTGEIPMPNDLVLMQDPSTLGVPPAQAELLEAFAAKGGFPNDQALPVTLSFAREVIHDDGAVTTEAPDLDFASFGPDTLFVYGSIGGVDGEVALAPITDGDYTVVAGADGGEHGVLAIYPEGRGPWEPGRYTVVVRGGPEGVKTAAGDPIYASQIFYLIAQGEDLTTEQNLGLLAATAGSREAALPLAETLNQLMRLYEPAFALADTRFPHEELAALATFAVAPFRTQAALDPDRGLVPLPIDLLRDPRPQDSACASCGKLTPLAACTLAGGHFVAPSTCQDSEGNPNAAAAGFAALDGFSTTAPILIPTSDLIQAATVNANTVFLYELSGETPVLVDPQTYIHEPCEMTQSGMSTVVALQPAGATRCDASSVFRTRPLADDTLYAVVVTDYVKDKTGTGLGRGTVASVLLFDNPVVSGTGASQLQGIDDATAGALEVMRQSLVPVVAKVAERGIAKEHIAIAYTFKTQSIRSVAAQLGALPYTQPAATALTGEVRTLTAADAFTKYGVDPTVVPSANIAAVFETTITTFNLLDPLTGAFTPDPAGATAETIEVLIVMPQAAAVPACEGALAPFGACAPMMVFRHGLGGGRADALLVADGFAAEGLATVAIDAAKHGDRSYCAAGETTREIPGTKTSVPVCADGAACVSPLPAGAQGDANPPGTCEAGFRKRAVSRSCMTGACPAFSDGIPFVSSSFLVSGNFFRTRDTLRQDIIDQSQLVRAIAFVPTAAPPTGHALFDTLAMTGVIIDPARIYYTGQSLGAIQGTMTVAANPRVSKAVLNVGGGTIVDLFTTSPAFASGTAAILAGLGIAPGTPAYLQFLSVAKTILDPADPVNFAAHLTGDTLPNLLAAADGSVAQEPKAVLTQVAFCDQVVPNPFSYVWASTMGVGPLPVDGTFGAPGTFQLFAAGVPDADACPAPGAGDAPASAAGHGFLSDFASPARTQAAQADAAAFLATDTQPSSLVVIP